MSYTRALCRSAVALALTFTVGACGDDGGSSVADAGPPVPDAVVPDAMWPDIGPAPALFTPRDDLTDDQLATQALALLGDSNQGGSDNCNDCHGLTRQRLYNWRALSDTTLGSCLTDLTVSSATVAKQMLDCLRQDPADDQTVFRAPSVGIFTSGAHLAWFEYAFKKAYGPNYALPYDDFMGSVGMPKGGNTPYTQPEFDIIATWFTRGLPLVDEKLPNDPTPTECTPGVSAAVASHVANMATTGWRAINAQNNLLMFGCGGAADVFGCLSTYPRAGEETFSEGWEVNVTGQVQRILRENGYSSAFWTRSSADGRFVGTGTWSSGANRSRIVDLNRDVSIPGTAYYDPAFFPDNSGFIMQGSDAYLCNQSLLVSEPTQINYSSESECRSTNNVGLYEHVGAALGGGDYWSVDGQFTSDTSGINNPRTSDPTADFSAGSDLSLTPIIHTGGEFVAQSTIRVETPYEGDAVISTSAKMVISRLRGPGDKQLGFVMREIVATPNGGSYDVTTPEVARYCFNGGKPAFSYNERWLTLHHYIGDADAVDLGFSSDSDPGFAGYKSQGAANVYLIDTLTGNVTRITHMKPGQYALYPHFRADGWLYWIVRTLGTGTEHIVASDAALRLEAAE